MFNYREYECERDILTREVENKLISIEYMHCTFCDRIRKK